MDAVKQYYNYRPGDSGAVSNEPRSSRPAETGKHHPWRRLLKRALLALVIVILVLAALLGGAYVYVTQTPIENTDGRTNIVILGVDEAAQLGDTILVASIRQRPQGPPEMAMVSIPRDLYVDVPGHGGHKINAAFALGENSDSAAGAGLTVDTIEREFDLPIHYYAALDFKAFKKIVNAVGGVRIDVETAIDDPFYPAPGYDGYDPFHINTGTHHLDGERALKYARSRKTTNDFDRAYRQQQVVLAVRDKLLDSGISLTNVSRVPDLLRVVNAQVDSNMNQLEMLRLAYALRNVETDSVPQYVLDTTNFLTSTSGGRLVPRDGDFQEIQQFLDSIFTQESVSEFERRF